MIFSKLFNYSMDRCWNGQGTTVMYFFGRFFFLNLTLGMTKLRVLVLSLPYFTLICLHSLVGLVEGTTKCNEYEMTGAPCWPIIMIGLGDLLLVVSHIYLVSEFYGWGQSFFFFFFFFWQKTWKIWSQTCRKCFMKKNDPNLPHFEVI
jgi:hypothetical protein